MQSPLMLTMFRIMTAWYQLKQDLYFPRPGLGMPKFPNEAHEAVEGRSPSARPVLFQGAVEGHVLVKNTKETLPLRSPRMLSLFGYSAKSPDLAAPAPAPLNFEWQFGWDLTTNMSTVAMSSRGTLIGGCGSGAVTPAVFSAPFESLKMRAAREDTALFHDFVSPSPIVDPLTDTCIVFGNAWACEGFDRPAIYDDYTDTLIKRVADQCSKTVVVFHNAGVRLVESFVHHPNVTAIIFAHLPGRDSGDALVSLLYGESNPSGKLPYTVAKGDGDYGHLLNPSLPEGRFQRFPQSDFTEGVYNDYKYFDKHEMEPRYEFGFGLSYTSFNLSNMRIETVPGVDTAEYPSKPMAMGGAADLWDVVVRVGVDVGNTGAVAGAEVAQLYVGVPGGPAKQLRGFEKRLVQPGALAAVEFALTRRDLSAWDTAAQAWRLQRGPYRLFVGTSSRNLPLVGSVSL